MSECQAGSALRRPHSGVRVDHCTKWECRLMRMLCLDFFESDWRDFRGRWLREYLREPEWIGQFLDRWNLHVAVSPNEHTLLALIELRSLMRRFVECLPDK